MTPEHIEELAAGYVLGNLSSEETEAFEQLLANQPQLHLEVEQLRETLELMPYALPEVVPPTRLRSAILDAIEPAAAPLKPIQQGKIRPYWVGIAAIAAISAIALGIDNYRLRRQLAAESPLPGRHQIVSAEVLQANGWDGVTRLVSDHMNSLDRDRGPVDFASTSVAEISDRFAPQFSFERSAPTVARTQVRLLGGSFCKLGKIKGIRFTYRTGNDRLISFYQLEASERNAFPLSGSDRLYIPSHRGPSAIVWNQDEILYALVSELPPGKLQEVAAHVR
ncbi:hypothetical protein IQ235_17185 [Oscillatoriales cyanobacterium LEGE 11467]|uniref:Anti-sigma factor n=1 Tax=Zarconia navalis LEGE 11467 TaxID=1828826 RepID=A0A928VYG6_9CYAN|nr:hypothetical protein [Zarconia navalis]MBE9042507.1 hypothetical protein [Zarconia navalis LEGE 11467]